MKGMSEEISPSLTRRTLLALAAGSAVSAVTAPRAQAAPVSDLWPRWAQHEPESLYKVDHGAWDDLLGRYLLTGPDLINRFDYRGVTAEDSAKLDRYLAELSETLISQYARDEQFAFWLNLYNALVVRLVLDHYPVDSIRQIDIAPSLFDSGPWGADLVSVEGAALSLDDIEHRILRPIWKDPRIHYVINCAAIGCPQIPPRAMTGGNREEMLETAARAFINHPRGVRRTSGGLPRGLVLSRIYDWYASDFGGYDDAVISHLLDYAEPKLAAQIKATPYIAGYEYDWSLNDAAKMVSG